MPDAQVLLAAREVARRFGSHVALAPASVEVRAGEALALIGPNGAGKSTLLSILAGALEPSQGRVVPREPAPKIGWVPQRPGQYGRLSARENLELFARLEGVAAVDETVGRLLGLVQLGDDGKPSAELSAGNQQRLNVALALLADPEILLLDEPTASLDLGQRRRLWNVARDVKERGGAVVFATQNLDELEQYADRVVVLRSGEVLFQGTLEEYAAGSHADVFA